MQIRPYNDQQIDAIIRISLRAWSPVFASIEQAMAPEVYQALLPDWRASQQKAVEDVCAAEETQVWVAEEDGSPVGFVAVKLHPESQLGEIYMLAVDPDFQRRGYGSALTDFALDRLKEAGMSVAMVETGGDPGHAPARRTYEKRGFGLLPIARYFKKL
jgi:ribosomal protein S18 acetylase RimI-like enzyme